MQYNKEYPEFAGSLNITPENLATVVSDDLRATVQLENDEEAKRLIAEFEDPEGELMYAEGSVFGKYESLHQFRP